MCVTVILKKILSSSTGVRQLNISGMVMIEMRPSEYRGWCVSMILLPVVTLLSQQVESVGRISINTIPEMFNCLVARFKKMFKGGRTTIMMVIVKLDGREMFRVLLFYFYCKLNDCNIASKSHDYRSCTNIKGCYSTRTLVSTVHNFLSHF